MENGGEIGSMSKPDVRELEVPWRVPKGYRNRFVLSGSGGGMMEVSMARRNAVRFQMRGKFCGPECSLARDWLELVTFQLRKAAGAE